MAWVRGRPGFPVCDAAHMTGESPECEAFYLNPKPSFCVHVIVSRNIQLQWLLHTDVTRIEAVGRIKCVSQRRCSEASELCSSMLSFY